MLNDSVLYDLNASAEQVIDKYKERLIPIVLFLNVLISSFSFGFIYTFYKLTENQSYILFSSEFSLFFYLLCIGILCFTVLFFLVVNIGYLKPTSNVFKVRVKDFEAEEIKKITNDFSLTDYDNLFKIQEDKCDKQFYDIDKKTLCLFKSIYKDLLANQILDLNEDTKFSSKFLHSIKYDY